MWVVVAKENLLFHFALYGRMLNTKTNRTDMLLFITDAGLDHKTFDFPLPNSLLPSGREAALQSSGKPHKADVTHVTHRDL